MAHRDFDDAAVTVEVGPQSDRKTAGSTRAIEARYGSRPTFEGYRPFSLGSLTRLYILHLHHQTPGISKLDLSSSFLSCFVHNRTALEESINFTPNFSLTGSRTSPDTLYKYARPQHAKDCSPRYCWSLDDMLLRSSCRSQGRRRRILLSLEVSRSLSSPHVCLN